MLCSGAVENLVKEDGHAREPADLRLPTKAGFAPDGKNLAGELLW
jgi:hypothetical protein